MALKDILVHVDQSVDSPGRMQLAFDLAARHASRLVALYVLERGEDQYEERRTAQMGLVPAKAYSDMLRRERETTNQEAERIRSEFEALGVKLGVEIEWRPVVGSASELLAQHARNADLCIVSHHPVAGAAAYDYSLSEKLLFITGRPVLFVPPGAAVPTLGRKIAVAWNSSRAAARTIGDAMPLFERAETTTVLTVNAADFIDRNGGLSADELLRRLTRNGAACDLVQLDGVASLSIADVLQTQARKLEADLLVAGAFGHPKLWEKLFGGVTRGLLDRMTMPILMSN